MAGAASGWPFKHKTEGFVLESAGDEPNEHKTGGFVPELAGGEPNEHKTGEFVPEAEEESRSCWMRALNLSDMGLWGSCQ